MQRVRKVYKASDGKEFFEMKDAVEYEEKKIDDKYFNKVQELVNQASNYEKDHPDCLIFDHKEDLMKIFEDYSKEKENIL